MHISNTVEGNQLAARIIMLSFRRPEAGGWRLEAGGSKKKEGEQRNAVSHASSLPPAANREEMQKLACWIDLVVPYCGDYLEANAWGPFETARYKHFLNKRKKMEVVEAGNIAELIASREEEVAAARRDEELFSTTSLMTDGIASHGQDLLRRPSAADTRSPGGPGAARLAPGR